MSALLLSVPAQGQATPPTPAAHWQPGTRRLPTVLPAAPWLAPRAGAAATAPAHAASLLGDGPWRRRDALLLGALLGGTVGALGGAAVHFFQDDPACDGGMGTACVVTVPTGMLASMAVGGLVGAGIGAITGMVVCERRPAGCHD